MLSFLIYKKRTIIKYTWLEIIVDLSLKFIIELCRIFYFDLIKIKKVFFFTILNSNLYYIYCLKIDLNNFLLNVLLT
jgi:hypothetical protein